MCSSVSETYEYDYLGNRTAKTSGGVTTEYTTDLSSGYSQVLKATEGNTTVYYTRGFELISRREGTTASYYVYNGGLSVRALTNEAGTVTDTLVFDAFGNETGRTGTTDNPYRFQGEEQDSTGLYYLRARYMDPATGTFTTMDTYGGSLSDPMSLHKYLVANSNPVMYSDPSGHSSLTLGEAIGICAIIGALSGAFLYDLGFLRNENEAKSLGGYLTYAVIGAIIAIVIFLVIYLIAKLIAFIVVWLGLRPQDAETIEEGVKEATENTQRFALGVKEELDSFAEQFNALTYKAHPEGTHWRYYVEQMIKNPNVEKYFNLNGIDLNNLAEELKYAEVYEKWGRTLSGFHWTSWEMYLIKSNGLEDTVKWFLNGVETTPPFI